MTTSLASRSRTQGCAHIDPPPPLLLVLDPSTAMANFGELVLILGDYHIPTRASKVPAAFKRMLVPNKMQHVICTGNLSVDDYEELRPLAPNLHVVAGEYDDGSTGLIFPDSRVIQVGSFRIGVIHGHQILPWNSPEAVARMRRKMNVDVLVTGHTHKNEVSVQEGGYYHINPVSAQDGSLLPASHGRREKGWCRLSAHTTPLLRVQ
jgi:vacuolar protein sorting-associated protein 29